MKKYKFTKITVKTREIISVPVSAVHENQSPVCPVCHAPLPASAELSTNVENSAVKYLEQSTIEPLIYSDDQKKYS